MELWNRRIITYWKQCWNHITWRARIFLVVGIYVKLAFIIGIPLTMCWSKSMYVTNHFSLFRNHCDIILYFYGLLAGESVENMTYCAYCAELRVCDATLYFICQKKSSLRKKLRWLFIFLASVYADSEKGLFLSSRQVTFVLHIHLSCNWVCLLVKRSSTYLLIRTHTVIVLAHPRIRQIMQCYQIHWYDVIWNMFERNIFDISNTSYLHLHLWTHCLFIWCKIIITVSVLKSYKPIYTF